MPVAERTLAGMSPLKAVRMLRYASDEYASRGVTTAQSGGVDYGMADGMSILSSVGLVKPRLVLFPFYDMLGAKWLAGEFDPAEMNSEKIIIGPIKIVADGSIQGYTGYLSEPYHAGRVRVQNLIFWMDNSDSPMHLLYSQNIQNLDLQIDALKKAGCEKIFTDEGISGITIERDGLSQAAASVVRRTR